ncbi:hypothetical protein FMM05_16975 [Flavobacterium zepuense]|uniref:Uncharacterized protein n=1 Tax=Flavobacterium zepuense TaxID=2593302 RepID=A0A552UWG4_9FLAO|nr:hypothetical protein [Flavobacterium zepuense]TRW22573.1 hypothetical protein FMM05_16975 [Flavobacterium zepuense]
MANNRIVIAQLDVDISKAKEQLKYYANSIDDTIETMKRLTAEGKTNTVEFKNLENQLKYTKELHSELAKNIDVLTASMQTQLEAQKKLDAIIQQTNTSENEFIKNNEELLRQKKALIITDADYEANLTLINSKIAENNKWLQENGSEHARLITTMNDYKQQVKESFDSINIFNGGISGLTSRAQEAGGAIPLLKNAFNGVTGGIKGMGAAIMANPIGAIIGAIVIVAQGLYNVFKDFKPLMDKVEQGMAAVGAVIDTIKNSIIGLLTGAASFGEFFSGITTGASKAASEAMNLKKAQQELAKQMGLQDIANQKAQVQMAEYIALSKDQNLSEEDRIKAYKKAATIESQNYAQRKKIANDDYNNAVIAIAVNTNLTNQELANLKTKGVAYAQELAEKKAISKEELDLLKKTQLERIKIDGEERGLVRKHNTELGAMHKQFADDKKATDDKNNADALKRQQEHEQKRTAQLDRYAAKLKLELDIFMQAQGEKSKSLKEELDYAEEVKNKKLAIARAEFNASEKTANDRRTLQLAENEAKAEGLKNTAEATAKYAQSELDLYIQTHVSKLNGAKTLTQDLIAEEEKRLEHIKNSKIKILDAESKTNQQIIDDKRAKNIELSTEDNAYLTKKAEIESEFKTQTQANNDALEAQTKAQKAAQLQADKDIAVANAQTQYDADLITEQQRFEAELETLKTQYDNKLLTKEQYDAKVKQSTEVNADNEKKIEQAKNTAITSQYATLFGNVSQLLGKKTAAGKAAAIAEATMNTYNGVTQVWASKSVLPEPMATVAKVANTAVVVASGLSAVKKITSTKEPKLKQGGLVAVGGNRHSNGGTMFTGADGTRFEAEQGELIGIMNRNAAAHFMAFNNAFPAGGSAAPNYFANGGIVSREMATPGINIDELAAKIAIANAAIPAPVVSVQDIITQGNSFVQVRDGANF